MPSKHNEASRARSGLVRRSLWFLVTALVAVAIAAGSFVMSARSGWLKPDEREMHARYGLPNSRYVTVDGQMFHYVDEGQGPAVVLVHGSADSLRTWDAWAAALRPHYRVVRFDRPFAGLSGPAPDGRFDGEAEARSIGMVADHLRLGTFALVATSSSGEGAAHYAAVHPDRISALILANIAARPLDAWKPDHPLATRFAIAIDPWLNGWHLPAMWRGILRAYCADPSKVTPEIVERWTDLNNLTQGAPRVPAPDGKVRFASTPADLAAIRAPTLLLWSDRDPATTLDKHGRLALKLLGTARKSVVFIANCGHVMPLECGPESVTPALAFFQREIPSSAEAEGGKH